MYRSISTVSLGMFGIFKCTVENNFRQQKGDIHRRSICRMPDCLCVPVRPAAFLLAKQP